MNFIWTAFLVGLAGSFHCVGMCGPIALALPGGSGSTLKVVSGKVLYNLGRIITYALLGGVFAVFGQAFLLADMQQGLSIILGVCLLLIAMFSFNLESKLFAFKFMHGFTGRIRQFMGLYIKRKTTASLFFIGILNGLLPCGFVYIGLFGSVTTNSIPEGMAYMALFGLGTMPLMLATSLAGPFISMKSRTAIKKLTPYLLAVFALLFIVRGLNLGIPFLSPLIGAGHDVGSCH